MYNYVGVLSGASAIMALQYQDVLILSSSCLIPFLFGETKQVTNMTVTSSCMWLCISEVTTELWTGDF